MRPRTRASRHRTRTATDRHRLRLWAAAGAATLVGLTGAPAGPSSAAPDAKPPHATTTIRCEPDSSGHRPPGNKYDGDSASYLYDRRFDPGPTIPRNVLTYYTPQALAYWKNWDGNGKDLLLVSFHGAGSDRLPKVMGLDPERGPGQPARVVGTASIGSREGESALTHAGSMAIANGRLYIDGPKDAGWHTIRRYSLDHVRTELKRTGTIYPQGGDRRVYGASFMTTDGSKLYAGKFNPSRRDWMYRYTIHDDGSLTTDQQGDGDGLRWEVPRATQGVAKSGGTMFFSSSRGRDKRGNFYATKASETNLDRARVRCFRAPSMSQGIAIDRDRNRLYLNYESGSSEFDGRHGPRARNVIPGPHVAPVGKLVDIEGGTIRLGRLHSQKQNDTFGEDEISIGVDGSKVGKTIDIEQGMRKPVDRVVQFTGNARVTLKELDNPPVDDHDDLGTEKVSPGADSGILRFAKNGAVYRLSYTVR